VILKWHKYRVVFFLVVVLCLSIPIITNVYWQKNAPEGFWFTGFLQSDQITYTALSRSVFERGNGVAYSYPYAAPSDENAAVNFQIPFTLLAWLWKITGSIVISWEIIRLLFGAAFLFILYLTIWELFQSYFPDEQKEGRFGFYVNLVFVILAFGGGIAWLATLARFMGSKDSSFLTIFQKVEGVYHWWFLNLFRNIYYPLELMYHTFFFLAIWGVLKKDFRLALVGQILACASGVFVGIEISGILIVYYLWETARQKSRTSLRHFAGTLIVFALFANYYGVFLPRFPISKNLAEQHRVNIHDIIPMREYLAAYGLMLFAALFVLLKKDIRQNLLGREAGRLMFVWLIVVAALVLNDKWLPAGRSLQPPHFTRGYLFSILTLIAACGFYPIWKSFAAKEKSRLIYVSIFLILLFIPDNILFVAERFNEAPHPMVLMIPNESRQLFDYLNTLKVQRTVFCPERKLGDQIPAFTPHASILGQLYATPFNDEKSAMMERFFQGADVDLFIKKYGIDLIVIGMRSAEYFDAMVRRPEWKRVYSNKLWTVYAIPAAGKS